MWGSPYGATVGGYETLHEIHSRMRASALRGCSRYQIVRVLTPLRTSPWLRSVATSSGVVSTYVIW